jgi:dTDP-4-dehydrorhamnose reductase
VKVLVTGRTGQIARALAEAAAGRPELELVAVGRPQLDLEAPASIARVMVETRPDVVINAAAYTAVDQAEDEPERALRINAQAPAEIAACCRESGARLIHISTDYVFNGESQDAYRPDAPTHPLGSYGRSKLQGELEIRAGTGEHLIVRTAWVYSPFGRNFVKTMIDLATNRDVVRVVADQHGNPSSAADIAEGLLRIVEAWRGGARTGLGQIYHLAGTGAASWAEFAEAIFAACARRGLPSARVEPISTKDWPTRARRPRNSRLDGSGFARDFGFRMPAWQESLERVVERLAVDG